MAEWSDTRDKILCHCGVVSWTYTKLEGDQYLLQEACPNCDRKDNVLEIGSIEKMSHKKAEKIIESLCDILESNPMMIIGGGLARQVEGLAQHLEDVNRLNAAERVRKGWKIVMDGMMKGVQGLFPGMAAQKPQKPQGFALVGVGEYVKEPDKPAVTMVPGCANCRKPVWDYKPELRWKIDGLFCSECRSSVDKAAKIKVAEKRIEETKMHAGDMLGGIEIMKEQVKVLQG